MGSQSIAPHAAFEMHAARPCDSERDWLQPIRSMPWPLWRQAPCPTETIRAPSTPAARGVSTISTESTSIGGESVASFRSDVTVPAPGSRIAPYAERASY